MATHIASAAQRFGSPIEQLRLVDQLERGVKVLDASRLSRLVNWSGGKHTPIHRWFRYREGFSPLLIDALHLGTRLLDPFCGSGSILVGAAQSRKQAIGFDVNPLATFVAEVKTQKLSAAEMSVVRSFHESGLKSLGRQRPWSMPALGIAHKVFEPEILETLLQIRARIESRLSNVRERNFVLLAWLDTLEKVGSYYKEGNGIKYRNKKRTQLGYVVRKDGDWQRERFGANFALFVVSSFLRQLETMIADTHAWSAGTWNRQRVRNTDAVTGMSALRDGTVDSVIFSPPYANRFDYFESLKVELWFGSFVSTAEDVHRLRKQSMRSHLGADFSDSPMAWSPLEGFIEHIDHTSYARRMRVPMLLRGYFSDMRAVLAESRRLLRAGGSCYCVVGNSAYGGAIIPTDSLIATLAREVGFSKVEIRRVRHLTVAPQQRAALEAVRHVMRESVVVMS